MTDSKLKIWLPLLGAALFAAGLWGGFLLAEGDRISPAQAKLNNVLEILQNDYVDPLDMDSLVELTIPAILKNLDPHTLYIAKSELEKANRDLESSFYGVGVSFNILNDSVYVVEVIAGSPAERAGIKAGDRITAVDGKPFAGQSITNDDVFSTLRGDLGSEVTLTIKRNTSKKPLEFTLQRAEIPSVSVNAAYMLNDNTGYVAVSKFAPNTYAEFIQAMTDLRFKGADNFVLDLRGNAGGLLDQAIRMADEFLEQDDIILSIRGRNADDDFTVNASGTGSFKAGDVVVLVDEFTASSSEIVTGALQDNDRAIVLGRRTFGKGLVQRPLTLPDSSQIRLTVQRYYTPSGRSIQKDFTQGTEEYDRELIERYASGEIFNEDSVKLHKDQIYHTVGGRTVYGGGGIMPDHFVASDTTGLSSYYFQVSNAGLLNNFAYEYADLNRPELENARNAQELLKLLPSDDVLLWAFVKYATAEGVPQRWYYINISSKLIVNQLKALIARDILGVSASYEIHNQTDPAVVKALEILEKGVNEELFKPQQSKK